MKDNEEIIAFSCNDHVIFFDEFGILFERIGLAWKKDKDSLERLIKPIISAKKVIGVFLRVRMMILSIALSSPIVEKRYLLKIYIISLDILNIFHRLFPT